MSHQPESKKRKEREGDLTIGDAPSAKKVATAPSKNEKPSEATVFDNPVRLNHPQRL
jgi:hypothetical protein